MKNFGYIRVAASSPCVRPSDIDYNVKKIESEVNECINNNVDIIVFPELSITGYTCGDLFNQDLLLRKASDALIYLSDKYRNDPITIVVGVPIKDNVNLYNCAAIISQGEIKGIVPKSYVPNYGEYYEKRWFTSGLNSTGTIKIKDQGRMIQVPFGTDLLFSINGIITGIEICEDLWVPNPPSSSMSVNGATLILNLSATNELIGKYQYLCELIANQSARCRCGYIYASAGTGESSTDLAFAGNAIIAENGKIICKSERFQMTSKLCTADIDIEKIIHDRIHFETFSNQKPPSEIRIIIIDNEYQSRIYEPGYFAEINRFPFLDQDSKKLKERCDEISSIQAWGLAIRLRSINCNKAIIGISGGLDSTLALLVTVKAFDMLGLDHKNIIGVIMPGFGTSDRTKSNAVKLMEILGVTIRNIPISNSVNQHFKDIEHDSRIHNVTYENSQARMRTLILMDIANQMNGIVIGTGDLSELALGWCTYNGDQMSMYGVNASIPKTLVKYLVGGYAENTDNDNLKNVLNDIIDTPISPELLPSENNNEPIAQKTEDLVGPYELHDFFLYNLLRYGMEPQKILMLAKKAFKDIYKEETIKHWLKIFYKRFFNQQFKRSVMPDGIKAGSVCLSPRGDWRMPSDISSVLFTEEIN